MTAVTYPPANPFAIPDGHPNRTAHEWLDARLDVLDWRFRDGLLSYSAQEQAKWRQLVLNMTVNDVYVLPKVWRPVATRFVDDLDPPVVIDRLSALVEQ